MKQLLLLLTMALAVSFVNGQPSNTTTEEHPYVEDDIEYGFTVRNISTKEVNNRDYSRYEVNLYATNKSQCSRIILFSQNLGRDESDLKKLVRFDCLNATGAKLTSKSGTVDARPMYVTARVNTHDAAGKSVTENQRVQIGYYLGVGESVSNNVIFIVPLNEKPDVRVRIINRASTL